jgi:hypothetical protein
MMNNKLFHINQMSTSQVANQLKKMKLETMLSIADVYYYANVFELHQPLSPCSFSKLSDNSG